MGSRELDPGRCEANIGIAGQDQADACSCTIYGGDNGLGQTEVIGEVRIQ